MPPVHHKRSCEFWTPTASAALAAAQLRNALWWGRENFLKSLRYQASGAREMRVLRLTRPCSCSPSPASQV